MPTTYEQAQTVIQNFRQKYPQYDDMDDATLSGKLASRYPEYQDVADVLGGRGSARAPSRPNTQPEWAGALRTQVHEIETGRTLVPGAVAEDGSQEWTPTQVADPRQVSPEELRGMRALQEAGSTPSYYDPELARKYGYGVGNLDGAPEAREIAGQIRAREMKDYGVVRNVAESAAHTIADIGSGFVGITNPELADDLRQGAEAFYKYDPESKGAVAGTFLGNVIPLIPAMVSGGSALAWGTAGGLGGSTFGNVRADVARRREAGESISTRDELLAAGLSAIAEFAGERVGLGTISKLGKDVFTKSLSRAMWEYASATGVNAGEEALTALAQNFVNQQLIDPKQDIAEGVPEAAAMGGAVGVFGAGVSHVAGRSRRSGQYEGRNTNLPHVPPATSDPSQLRDVGGVAAAPGQGPQTQVADDDAEVQAHRQRYEQEVSRITEEVREFQEAAAHADSQAEQMETVDPEGADENRRVAEMAKQRLAELDAERRSLSQQDAEFYAGRSARVGEQGPADAQGAKSDTDIAGAFGTMKNAATEGYIDSMWGRVQQNQPIPRMGEGSLEHKLREAQKAGQLQDRDAVAKIVADHFAASKASPAVERETLIAEIEASGVKVKTIKDEVTREKKPLAEIGTPQLQKIAEMVRSQKAAQAAGLPELPASLRDKTTTAEVREWAETNGYKLKKGLGKTRIIENIDRQRSESQKAGTQGTPPVAKASVRLTKSVAGTYKVGDVLAVEEIAADGRAVVMQENGRRLILKPGSFESVKPVESASTQSDSAETQATPTKPATPRKTIAEKVVERGGTFEEAGPRNKVQADFASKVKRETGITVVYGRGQGWKGLVDAERPGVVYMNVDKLTNSELVPVLVHEAVHHVQRLHPELAAEAESIVGSKFLSAMKADYAKKFAGSGLTADGIPDDEALAYGLQQLAADPAMAGRLAVDTRSWLTKVVHSVAKRLNVHTKDRKTLTPLQQNLRNTIDRMYSALKTTFAQQERTAPPMKAVLPELPATLREGGTLLEIRDWANANGYTGVGVLGRQKLIERIDEQSRQSPKSGLKAQVDDALAESDARIAADADQSQTTRVEPEKTYARRQLAKVLAAVRPVVANIRKSSNPGRLFVDSAGEYLMETGTYRRPTDFVAAKRAKEAEKDITQKDANKLIRRYNESLGDGQEFDLSKRENAAKVVSVLQGKTPLESLPATLQQVVQDSRAQQDQASMEQVEALEMAASQATSKKVRAKIEARIKTIRGNIGKYTKSIPEATLKEGYFSKIGRKSRKTLTKNQLSRAFGKVKRDAWIAWGRGKVVLGKFPTKAEAIAFRDDYMAEHPGHKPRITRPRTEQERLEKDVQDPRIVMATGIVEAHHDAQIVKLHSFVASKYGQKAPKKMSPDARQRWAEERGLEKMPHFGRYHGLRGMYVPAEIAADLTEFAEFPNAVVQFSIDAMSVFKEAVVVHNPASHGRNVITNTAVFSTLARTSPLNPRNWTYYRQAAAALKEKGALWDEMRRADVIGGNYSDNELTVLTEDLISPNRPAPLALLQMAKKVRRFNREVYSLEDEIFKAAAYLKYRAEGSDTKQAGAEVNKWFPNYGRTSKLARAMTRNPIVGAPFTAFTDQSVRIAGRAITDRPVRLGTVLAAPILLSQIAKAMAGISDDEDEVVQAGKGFVERYATPYLPWRDSKGNALTLDLRYIIPLLNDVAPDVRNGNLVIPWFFSMPLGRFAVEQFTGENLFTGRKFENTDIFSMDRAESAYRNLAPVPAIIKHAPGRVFKADKGRATEDTAYALIGSITGANARRPYVSEKQIRDAVKAAIADEDFDLANEMIRIWNGYYMPEKFKPLDLENILDGLEQSEKNKIRRESDQEREERRIDEYLASH